MSVDPDVRRAQVRAAQARYKATAKGRETDARYDATTKGIVRFARRDLRVAHQRLETL